MISFHYVICDEPIKNKHHVKKLIFLNKKLDSTDNLNMNQSQIEILKNSIDDKDYTTIHDSKIDLDNFLKNLNLFI